MRGLVSIPPRHFARLSNASINSRLKNHKTEICVTTPKSAKREVQIILALTYKMAGNLRLSPFHSHAILLDTRVFGCIFLSFGRSADFLSSPGRNFVAHLYAWEAKIKAEKNRRRPPNPSQSRNPAAGVKHSRQSLRSRASSTRITGTEHNGHGEDFVAARDVLSLRPDLGVSSASSRVALLVRSTPATPSCNSLPKALV